MSSKGIFITFEGIDGCGKSTQAKLLLEYLNGCGKNTILVREPGGTTISEEIRQVLLSTDRRELTDRTEVLLMVASRAQLTDETIVPNLESGKCVIADRYIDSTVAYQGGGRGIDISWLHKLNQFATERLVPNITFFVDILPEEAARRKQTDSDRIEEGGVEFQAKVREVYMSLAEKESNRIIVMNGYDSVEEIHQKIIEEINRRNIVG
ncbi:MAG: dTMP kinase [Candidatus Marinimicrobia bacterium]|nr:dTMP kinase [Candidatus Neomarinimicrobiota bacterium]MBT3618169.1 dTMP kinase [Candidatus Neomarinimicrobiota bacterium]MBT3828640.1 dTMP kinase [Candidatus Neomarinimicrobiota bacterium]MBT3996898.1 dTMP kinase [Candidatus Neomarinimicrobiota bacterium]MBT4280862.1 dTMP kinase [Candidatus Neomarinimicrobiota bacterium]